MNKKTLLKLILVIAIVVGIAGGGYYLLFSKPDLAGNTVADNTFGWKFPIVKFPITGTGDLAYSSIRDPGGIPSGLPVRLQIPVIGVDSAIEDALITPDGRMDVPQGTEDVAWFALGPHPGQTGSAVIGGHFGINNGVKFVFYDLDKLVVGDKIYILDDKGDTLAFQVRSVQLFDRNADATTVFTSNDGLAHLNLITCEGVWNQVNGAYPLRRVVFTDAIPAEGAAPTSVVPTGGVTTPIAPATVVPYFNTTLTTGSKGTDVTALQTGLQKMGFLGVSAGALDGSFGKATRAALAKYQTSIGLSPDGVFGPVTRAKFSSDLAIATKVASPVAIQSGLPSTGEATPSTTISGYIKSLYATTTDGIITSLLIILIIFISLKIIF